MPILCLCCDGRSEKDHNRHYQFFNMLVEQVLLIDLNFVSVGV
jgi:hypothetical protein